MNINKDIMGMEARKLLSVLFTLPEVEKVAIKDVIITSMEDEENIIKGLDECYHDRYSDVDIVVHIRLHPNDFNSETPIYKKHFRRLKLEENIFGLSFVKRIKDKEGLRICLNSGIRIDFTCFCMQDETVLELPKVENERFKVSKQKDKFWEDWSIEKVDNFWFVSVLALGKLMRKDYLISLHLAHMLTEESLVAQMIIRDNDYNTNFHRYGYEEIIDYLTVAMDGASVFKKGNHDTYNYIVDLLYRSVISYDRLILQLNQSYESRVDIFLKIWESYVNE